MHAKRATRTWELAELHHLRRRRIHLLHQVPGRSKLPSSAFELARTYSSRSMGCSNRLDKDSAFSLSQEVVGNCHRQYCTRDIKVASEPDQSARGLRLLSSCPILYLLFIPRILGRPDTSRDMAAATQPAPVPAHELSYTPGELPKLRSNYGNYLNDDMVGWMKETPIDTPLSEMRRRFAEDGYVFVKDVMPREDVLDMREAYFEHLAPTDILKPGTSARDGIFDDREEPIAHNGVGGSDLPEAVERVNTLVSAHTMPFYLAFVEHPKLRQFVRDFMGWEKEVLIKRTMLR